MLFDDIAAKARTFIYAQYPVYATYDSTDCATYNGPNRTGCSLAFERSARPIRGVTLGRMFNKTLFQIRKDDGIGKIWRRKILMEGLD